MALSEVLATENIEFALSNNLNLFPEYLSKMMTVQTATAVATVLAGSLPLLALGKNAYMKKIAKILSSYGYRNISYKKIARANELDWNYKISATDPNEEMVEFLVDPLNGWQILWEKCGGSNKYSGEIVPVDSNADKEFKTLKDFKLFLETNLGHDYFAPKLKV